MSENIAWAIMWSVLFVSVATCSYNTDKQHGETTRAYIEHGYCLRGGWIPQWEKCKP